MDAIEFFECAWVGSLMNRRNVSVYFINRESGEMITIKVDSLLFGDIHEAVNEVFMDFRLLKLHHATQIVQYASRLRIFMFEPLNAICIKV